MTTQFGASSSSSPSSSATQSWTHDVFLSFRGEDTRNNFIGHLYNNMAQKGIKVFRDDDGLGRGEEISPALLKAIEESKISVVVFSKNYASSKWCLDELVKILHCKETKLQMIYPVFYKVDPLDVRNQKGSFAEALAEHERRFKDNLETASKDNFEKLVRWKTALTAAANLSGEHLPEEGHEANFIDIIVGEISKKLLKRTPLNVAKYPIGIESRVEDILEILRVGENDIRMVGIWGIGGIGKTTIAKAVYNLIAHNFEGSCFLDNVKESYGGLVQLQNLLLSELGVKDLNVNNVHEGVNVLKERLSYKRVLIIVDDVNDTNQLDQLVGEPNWFGPGSRIIITTRDMQCLIDHKVNQIYEVKKLNHEDALELLCWNALEENRILDQDSSAIIDDVLHYSNGLPLALIVIGSLLRNRSRDKWQAALKSHRKSGKGIHELLKISYDALVDDEKEVFLHIACFFKGKNKYYVRAILEACDLNLEHGIEVLRKMALININEKDEIWMHDLLEDMGKKIVIQESPTEPGERSRLWLYKDVHHVFLEDTGTNKVKGIMVKNGIPGQNDQIPLSNESFLKFKNLQILIISCDRNIFDGDRVNYLPNELRLLEWLHCPLQYFPSNFYLRHLKQLRMHFIITPPPAAGRWVQKICLKMRGSCTSPLGRGLTPAIKIMENLEAVDLSHCLALRKNPDFFRFPNLVDLNLSGCKKLVEFDPSVGSLEKLLRLNLSFCSKLRKFETVKEMKSLRSLNLGETAIEELSSLSIGHLINLDVLSLSGCNELTSVPCNIFELQHLDSLDISQCRKLVTFPTKSEISSSNRGHHDNKYYEPLTVKLNHCTNLVEISEFGRDIYSLDASHCYSLRRVSKLSNILEGKESKMCPRMNLFRCDRLSPNLALDVAKLKKNLPDDSEETALVSLFLSSCRVSEFQVTFPCRKIPEWFTRRLGFQRLPRPKPVRGTEFQIYNFRIRFPGNFNWENKGFAFCVQTDEDFMSHLAFFRLSQIYINGVCITLASKSPECPWWWLDQGHVWLYYVPSETILRRLSESDLPPPSDSICLVQFEFEYQIFRVVEEAEGMGSCGVHVVMAEDEDLFVGMGKPGMGQVHKTPPPPPPPPPPAPPRRRREALIASPQPICPST